MCLKVLAHLTAREVVFEKLDVDTDERAMDELIGLGVTTLPVVRKGDRFVVATDLGKVNELVGLDEAGPALLPFEQCIARIIRGVLAAARYSLQVPADRWTSALPAHGTFAKHAAHCVSHAAYVHNVASLDHYVDPRPAVMDREDSHKGFDEIFVDQAHLAARARELAVLLADWLTASSAAQRERTVETIHGPTPLPQLVFRNAYSVIQHTRLLMVGLELMGIEPDDPLDAGDFAGLSVPEAVY